MDGCRFIEQCNRLEVTAAYKSADPRARVDGVEHRIVEVHLLLHVEIHRAESCIGTIQGRPV